MQVFQRTTKTEAYDIIKRLIDKYEAQKAAYLSAQYNEARTRQDFIDLFFEALGWDIHNQNNEIETLREVTVEDRLKINKSIRRPDYAFRANRKIQFYVEAKKPAVSLMFEREPANQVREYGWNGRTDVSVVTNFAELSIHDCTKKVTKRDGATTGRLKYLAYTDYLQNFDFLWEILAYENVINGSLEKYAQSKIDYKHAEPVNEAFLKALNDWREYLATNIAQRNKQLEEEDINFAVQMLIDRIVFLRVCEDRNIEPNEQLLQIAKSKGNTYQLLFDLFKIADQKYNSGIFNFKKDALTASLNIDNKVVKKILLEFYNDEDEGIGRFNFAMIPIEILGYAYEQFLGKVIVLEKTGKATIVEKHKDSEETKKGKASETRRAGGVYYTPSYIVDYIVENTVGKAVEGKTPEEVSNIKIIDPSCGSGSFLIGAYQYLLDWHLRYYTQNPPKNGKYKKENPLSPDGKYLTSIEKKRILLNNIYGIDIDMQAVEVSKLSLLLKALENETISTIKTSLEVFSERVLPTIDGNVQSGNSLISTDFYDQELNLTTKEERKVNVFDWVSEFHNVFLQGGFDCVIGNPPYGASFQKYEKDYLKKAYPFGDIEFESYLLFIQKSYLILKMGGRQGFIIPSNLFTNVRYEKTRALMLQKTTINDLIDLGSNVFSQASVDTCIEVFQKGYTPNNQIKTFIGNIGKVKDFAYHYILQDEMQKNASYLFDIYSSDFEKVLESKIEINTQPLENFVSFARGVEFGYKSSYITDDAKANNAQPIIAGRCIQRYNLRFEGKYVLYDETDLANFKSKDIYETEKILLRRIGNEIIAVYDNENYYNVCDVYNLLPKNILDLKYILALLNSKLMSFYLQTKFKNSKKLFPKIPIKYLEQLPIKPLDLQNKEDKTIHKNIVSYVNDLADLHKELNALPQNATEAQKVVIQKKIKRKQQVIDTAVYNLYNLDEADIKLIDKNYVVLESF